MRKVLDQVNKSIEQNDIESIEYNLNKLDDLDFLDEEVLDGEAFAKNIVNMVEAKNKVSQPETITRLRGRKMNRKRFMIIAATLVVCFGLGIVAFASGFFNEIKIYNDTETIQIRTEDNLSEAEVNAIVEDINEGDADQGSVVTETDYVSYGDVLEVEKELDVSITLPDYFPKDMVREEEIMVSTYFDDNHNIYLTYVSEEDENRMIGVTIVKESLEEGETLVSVTDNVFEKKYVSKKGWSFDLLHEDGGLIFTTNYGQEQYGFVFMGIDEEEAYKVVDSIDFEDQ